MNRFSKKYYSSGVKLCILSEPLLIPYCESLEWELYAGKILGRIFYTFDGSDGALDTTQNVRTHSHTHTYTFPSKPGQEHYSSALMHAPRAHKRHALRTIYARSIKLAQTILLELMYAAYIYVHSIDTPHAVTTCQTHPDQHTYTQNILAIARMHHPHITTYIYTHWVSDDENTAELELCLTRRASQQNRVRTSERARVCLCVFKYAVCVYCTSIACGESNERTSPPI